MFRYNSIIKPVWKPVINSRQIKDEKTEISNGVYVGNQKSYEINKKEEGFNFINACKYPYFEDYAKNHTHGDLFAYCDNRLICNLVDADDVSYIPEEIIEECVSYIEKTLKSGKKVLINCNEGRSRSATIGLIYLMKHNLIKGDNFHEILDNYREILPQFNPNLGMLSYARQYYDSRNKVEFCKEKIYNAIKLGEIGNEKTNSGNKFRGI